MKPKSYLYGGKLSKLSLSFPSCKSLKDSQTIPDVQFVTNLVKSGENHPIDLLTELPQDCKAVQPAVVFSCVHSSSQSSLGHWSVNIVNIVHLFTLQMCNDPQ